MGRYNELMLVLNNYQLINEFEEILEEELEKDIKKYPDLPKDYIEFLREVGWGDIEIDTCLSIFHGVIETEVIYKRKIKEIQGILYFGDYVVGDCYCGFAINDNWRIVEIYDDFQIRIADENFEGYIKSTISKYINTVTR
ncbi:hypothetical protein QTL86_00210 [Cellulosilyticum sp. ST5]|uniref:hypothetical protein n=1 Tax=Cellulosilyticum sp. ST5 TaxID=3055805 RepID=UPI0001D2DD6C